MDEIRVAFIGAGGNAAGHMQRVSQVEGVRLTAICDVQEDRARARAAEHQAQAYTDFRRMLDEQECDAVYVSVPPFAHGEPELAALERGCHLLVEKPVCLDMETGLRILEAVERAGVITAVGYQLRYVHAANALKDYLTDKTVAMVSHHRWGGLPGQSWWRVMDRSGGQLVEQTTHGVDMMRYLLGDIVEVYAKYATRTMGGEPNLTIPDSQEVLMEFECGALGLVSTACMSNGGGGKSEMSFLLRDQRIEFSYTNFSIVPEPEGFQFEPEDRPSIDEHFIRASREGDQSIVLSSYRDGLKTCDVTLAANRSAASGKPERPCLAGH